jgi:hypothetical protein
MGTAMKGSARSFLPRLRGHEVVFAATGAGAFLALLPGRTQLLSLGAEIGVGVVLYLAALLVLARTDGLGREKVRLLVNFLFTFWFYGVTSRVTQALGTPARDGELLACDEWLFGTTPAVVLERFVTPWLTDLLSACYLSYLIYLLVVLVWGLAQSEGTIRRYSASIFAGAASGYLTYLLVPALGPALAFPQLFSVPLPGGVLTQINDSVVARGRADYDTFPSLHLLQTLLLLDNDRRDCPSRFWIMLGPALGLVVSTVYLRHHYAIDLLAGVVYFLVIRTWCSGGRGSWLGGVPAGCPGAEMTGGRG